MLEKLIEELAEIIAEVLDAVFGNSVRLVIGEILNNPIIKDFINSMVGLTIIMLALAFVIALLNNMMNENKREVIGLCGRFIVLALMSFFVYDFATLFFGVVTETGINYIVTATSEGLADDFFTMALANVTTGGAAQIIMLLNLLFLLIMFVKFLIDLGKYAIQNQVFVFIYPVHAINALVSGWNELWNWFLNIFKIVMSVILLTFYMSMGMFLLLSAITITDPIQGFAKFIVGIILMLAKKPIETALGRLGLFNAGGNSIHAVSSTAMLARNLVGMLGK
ncbi:MAG: hypothetical protein ACK5K7_07495 [Bacilli bacterium]